LFADAELLAQSLRGQALPSMELTVEEALLEG
jgi:hypothetical protein